MVTYDQLILDQEFIHINEVKRGMIFMLLPEIRLVRNISSIFRNMTSENSVNLKGMRKAYNECGSGSLDVGNLVTLEPFANFRHWFDSMRASKKIYEPNAMCLATSTKCGRPSARMVLLKEYNEEGFKFFTNYESRKGSELAENPNAALLFYWDALHQQVRVEGEVTRVSVEDSEEYFHERPRGSQISAMASHQSRPIASRQVLEEKVKTLESIYNNDSELPKPDYWGGYLLKPRYFEFWQGNQNRLHDRIIFRIPADDEVIDPNHTHIGEKGWVYERLNP